MSKIRAVFLAACCASVWLAPARLGARESAPPQAGPQSAVATYAEELSRVENAKSRVSLERLFLQAYAVHQALTMAPAGGGPSALEAMSDQEFEETQERLRGVLVNRVETIYAVPDADFFEKLGERKGRTEDRLLLRLYHRTYSGSPFPVYVRQQTDYSGCTDFGPGILTKLYGEWIHYRQLHPDRYQAVVESEIDRIVEELTRSTCACGPSGSVQSELRYFLHRHPGSPVAPHVRERLNQILHGVSKIRFNCASG